MRIYVVPNVLRDVINVKLDTAISKCPGSEEDRDVFFQQLLEIFIKTGNIPDFELEKKR